MASNQSGELFDLVPDVWFESVIGVGTVLVGLLAVGLGEAVAMELFSGVAGTVAVVALQICVGLGLTYGYVQYRGLDVSVGGVDGPVRRWLAALVVAAIGISTASSLGHIFTDYFIGGPIVALEPVAITVGGKLGTAEYLAINIFLIGVLLGPVVGALFHGVFQETVSRVAPPAVVVAVTGLAVVIGIVQPPVRGMLAGFISTTHFWNAVVLFPFAVVVAHAYWKTESLLVPMAAYGVFNVVAVAFARVTFYVTVGHV